jgi:hypothetical protein
MNGLNGAIASYLGATVTIELKDGSALFTYTKK